MFSTITKSHFAVVALMGGTLIAAPAIAGDLVNPVVEPPVLAPAPVLAPVPVADIDDWTGFYAGGQLGYADVDGVLSGDGAIGGVHAGYDYDFGTLVLGAELDYDAGDVDFGGGVAQLDSITRLKLRGGYDFGRTLLYATGGVARADTSLGDESGGFGGVGMAYHLTDSFDLGGEVLYHDFSDIGATGIAIDATTVTVRGSFRF